MHILLWLWCGATFGKVQLADPGQTYGQSIGQGYVSSGAG